MSLKYPLHSYDESGRLKPPVFIYLILLFVCRGLILLVISLSFREDSERLLRLFYPLPYHFYLSLVPILPALLGLFLVSYRNSLWQKSRYAWFFALPIMMFSSLIIDAGIQLYILQSINFVFAMNYGVSLFLVFCGFLYLFKSRYIRDLVKDWTTP